MRFKKLLLCGTGEVSDTDKDASDGDFEEFDDGLDENMIGDEQDKKRLEQMTEKEREQEIFNRLEKREAMRTRYGVICEISWKLFIVRLYAVHCSGGKYNEK